MKELPLEKLLALSATEFAKEVLRASHSEVSIDYFNLIVNARLMRATTSELQNLTIPPSRRGSGFSGVTPPSDLACIDRLICLNPATRANFAQFSPSEKFRVLNSKPDYVGVRTEDLSFVVDRLNELRMLAIYLVQHFSDECNTIIAWLEKELDSPSHQGANEHSTDSDNEHVILEQVYLPSDLKDLEIRLSRIASATKKNEVAVILLNTPDYCNMLRNQLLWARNIASEINADAIVWRYIGGSAGDFEVAKKGSVASTEANQIQKEQPAIEAGEILAALKHEAFDSDTLRQFRDTVGERLMAMGVELEDVTLPEVPISTSARTAVDAIVAIDASTSRDPLDVATGLALATEAFGALAKDKIEQVMELTVAEHECTPEMSKTMHALSGLFQTAKSCANWCMKWVSSSGDAPSLDDAKREYDAKLYEEMKVRVFGDADPSIEGFQAYLNRLHSSTAPTTHDEKKEICKTVNYWRGQLSLSLYYGNIHCTLKAVSTRDNQGAYQLRGIGGRRKSIPRSDGLRDSLPRIRLA